MARLFAPTRNYLTSALNKAIKRMSTLNKYGRYPNGTYSFDLGIDLKNNRWAIVLGWTDGYDDTNTLVDEYGIFADGTFRLSAKLAFQPKNSVMQCDYDVDWLMPYDEETGDVDDTEVAIYDDTTADETVDYLLSLFDNYKSEFIEDDYEDYDVA